MSEFIYVALDPSEIAGSAREAVSIFLREVANQQIVPTGPYFLVYYFDSLDNRPSPRWELGLPTAEGTLVKPPLQLKRWGYPHLTCVRNVRIELQPDAIGSDLHSFLNAQSLPCPSPVAVLLWDSIGGSNPSSRWLKSEIWLPRAVKAPLAE
ncbi:MAG: hypothetical protein D6715_06000 [Calditrichaeota bacterium]|nr:MAG: hypothetical protein D6715_06000 [Calditrichota bacterium]